MPSGHLPEPESPSAADRFVLLGGFIADPRDPSAGLRVVNEREVERFPAETRATFAFFSRSRSRAEAEAFVVHQGGTPGDVEGLVADGILARMPGGPAARQGAALSRMRVLVTGILGDAVPGQQQLVVTARDGHRTSVSADGAAVLSLASGGPCLGQVVAAVAHGAGTAESAVWDVVVPDLDALLSVGAAALLPEEGA